MIKEITDDEFIAVSARITRELTESFSDYLNVGIIISAIAAEIFCDDEDEEEEEKEEKKKFTNLFEKDVDDMRYSIFTGGDVCKDDFVLMKETLPAQKVVYTRRFKTLSEAICSFMNEINMV